MYLKAENHGVDFVLHKTFNLSGKKQKIQRKRISIWEEAIRKKIKYVSIKFLQKLGQA